MTNKYHLFCIIALVFLISACKSQNNKPGSIENNTEFSATDFQQSLRDRFNKEDSSFGIKSSDIEYFDTLKFFYSARNFQPLFILNSYNASSVNSILTLFSNAWEQGIQPARYRIELIENEISKISSDN